MLRLLIVMVYLSLLCHKSSVERAFNTVDTTQELGWQSRLFVDSDTPTPHNEEVKKRQISRRSVFIAPAFSRTSHLPDCAEGYRPDSMGGCVKLVQLNHAAQLEFLLQRLNPMYAAPVTHRGYEGYEEDPSTSDSSSTEPLQMSIAVDIPPEPEEVTKESVDLTVVMADVFRDSNVENSNETDETQKSRTVVAVLNVGKNETPLEEMENSGDLEMESDNLHHEEGDLKLSASNATKYEVINESEYSSVSKASLSTMDEKQLLSTTSISVLLSEESHQSLAEPTKPPDSAMGLLEEVGNVSSEDGRSENTTRRNASADENAKKEATTETVKIITEPREVNAVGTKHNRNRDFQLKIVLSLLVIIWRYQSLL
jgi:hypothetical protein